MAYFTRSSIVSDRVIGLRLNSAYPDLVSSS